MLKQIDEDKPIGEMKIINDFLPTPKELALKGQKQRITILLNKRSVDFFKKVANKNNIKYQWMIRELIEKYAEQYMGN